MNIKNIIEKEYETVEERNIITQTNRSALTDLLFLYDRIKHAKDRTGLKNELYTDIHLEVYDKIGEKRINYSKNDIEEFCIIASEFDEQKNIGVFLTVLMNEH